MVNPGLPEAPHIEQQTHCANRDCAVGDIKRRKLVRAEEELQEISDGALKKAVPHITQRAAKNQGQPRLRPNRGMYAWLAPPQHSPDDGHHG